MKHIAINIKPVIIGVSIILLSASCQEKKIETKAPKQIVEIISEGVHKGYTITGTVSDLNATKLYLVDHLEQVVDSATVTNTAFVLKGTVAKPDTYTLLVNNEPQSYPIVVENTSYTVFINNNEMMTSGGDLNTKLVAFKSNESIYNTQRLKALKSFTAEDITVKELRATLDAITKEESNYTIGFIEDNQDNLLSSIGLSAIVLPLEAALSLSKNTKNAKNTHLVSALSENLAVLQKEEETRIAAKTKAAEVKVYRAPAPYFTGESLAGPDLAFVTVLEGKKAVLIDFWASWCKPCRMVTPQIRSLYQRYYDLGFDVITVSEDKNRAAWQQGVLEDQMTSWNHIYDERKDIAASYGVRAIPHMVLIDGKGRIIKDKISLTQLKTELTKIFK